MSIVACSECGKKISNRAVICNFCGFHLGEVSEHDLEIFRARKLRDRIYKLNMVSYAVITVFVAGFGWYWWDSGGFVVAPSTGPYIVMGIAALAYVAVRFQLFRCRQQRKAMRQKVRLSNDLRRNL